MAIESFTDLWKAYGNSPVEVPDEQLYRYIIDTKVFASLVDHQKLGLEKHKELPLVQEVRRRCEQDLWFLGRYFLWDTDVFGAGKPIEESFFKENVHRRIADLFVKKDKTKSIANQDWRKDRIVLYPRGNGKSAWDRYDVVQWTLNFPDIRVLYLTAEQGLAEGFVGETKSHFYIRDDEPSLMNVFFPEYCFLEKDGGPADKLTCPLWAAKKVNRKEPTVWGSSVESKLSGKHFEVIKGDDCVGDENSLTEEQCNKIAYKFNLKNQMRIPAGYTDKIGTRYADEDMYGQDLRNNIGNLKREAGSNWEIIDNLDTGLRILIGRDLVIKPEVAAKLEAEGRPVTYAEAGKDGCTLLFPEHHTYEWCMAEFAKNEKIFEGQQNQNPRPASTTAFDRALLMKHTIPFNDPLIPITGPITQTWDFAFSKKKGRDWTTACTAIWSPEGKMIILDLVRAKFTPAGLAKAVVDFAAKWRPTVIGIENAGGSHLLAPSIAAEAAKLKIPEIVDVCTRIDWFEPDNQADAKKTRMMALHPLMVSDMLYFVNSLQPLDILYDEFERCLNSHHHDDIPDVISQQPRYAPRMVQLLASNDTEQFSRSDGNWMMIYDQSGELYGTGENFYNAPFKGFLLRQNPDTGEISWVSEEIPNPVIQIEPEPEPATYKNEYALDPILGGLIG